MSVETKQEKIDNLLAYIYMNFVLTENIAERPNIRAPALLSERGASLVVHISYVVHMAYVVI